MSQWPKHQLRYSFSVYSGATPKSSESVYWDGDIPWITPEDLSRIQSGYRLTSTRRSITNEGYESCGAQLAPKGSICLSKRAPIGLLAILDIDACSNQGCLLLIPKGQYLSRFYYYLLLSEREWLQALGRGSTFMELSVDDIKSLLVYTPHEDKQFSIASYLDRETAKIDGLIAAKERQVELMAEKRRALITQVVTRGLNPDAPLRDSGIPWLSMIPEHWEVRRIAHLFNQCDTRAEPDLPLLEVSINMGVALREFSGDRIEGTAADFNSYKVARKGDIVFNKMRMWQGAVGLAPEDGLVSPDYTVAASLPPIVPEYAALLFRTAMFSAECARNSQGIVWDRLRLYWEGFRDISVPLPPLNEQREIVAHIEVETGKIDALSKLTRQTIALLKERRAALITAAVTGQIDVEAA